MAENQMPSHATAPIFTHDRLHSASAFFLICMCLCSFFFYFHLTLHELYLTFGVQKAGRFGEAGETG
jgi:hypothetical protein